MRFFDKFNASLNDRTVISGTNFREAIQLHIQFIGRKNLLCVFSCSGTLKLSSWIQLTSSATNTHIDNTRG